MEIRESTSSQLIPVRVVSLGNGTGVGCGAMAFLGPCLGPVRTQPVDSGLCSSSWVGVSK
ncbi:hypothetical protein P691DRAFT_810280 [Macrolepiota fuliginosa MF-IS2]|uniref:Uncharacterized protein n=1 Tax=Macrolepiota fuliginosa MF-IS2 TaxID=1400762 RepID=A0A9P5XGB8_9AGAR|nr:hypothetical protein P691DRAFT_810280 [Macrolepiota fuliginosa MF-IS2]